jgi:hypothetical protein
MLWEKFNLEDSAPIESLPNTNYFIDLIKPSAPVYEYIKLIPISLVPLWLTLDKKRPIVEVWFIKPITKSRVPFISLIPWLVLRQVLIIGPLPLAPPPLPLVLAIKRP